MQASPTLTAKVRIQRVLYPRTGFSPGDFAIIACSIEDVIDGEPYNHNDIVIKGKVFSIDYGTLYRLEGKFVEEEKYGCSYQLTNFSEDYTLDDPSEQREYLRNVLTEKQYALLSEGLTNPFKTLVEGDVAALSTLKGLGPTKAQKIIDKFRLRLDQAKAFNHLSRYGMSMDSIATLLGKYPSVDALLKMIDEDPYIMIREVDGIGWAKADAIALGKGMATDDPKRVRAYITHFLKCRSDDGHTWCLPQELWDATSYDLQLESQEVMRDVLNMMHEAGELWWDEDKSRIALAHLREMEEKIARELHRIANGVPLEPSADAEFVIQEMERQQDWNFTEEQMNAVHSVLDNNVAIITGAAGCGKSASVSAILKLLSNHSFAQCALSGRAAARLTEVTHEQGSTIHRLLGFMYGQFAHNAECPLPYDIIVLDEISMVGAEIFLRLIEAIPTGAKLIMLGDAGQLEAIGLCNIFKDMLDSGVISVARLTKIHRQAAKSAIITESNKVHDGTQLCSESWIGNEVRGELKDLEIEVFSNDLLTFDNIIMHYERLLNQGVSMHQMQVVVPMKTRGEACTLKINKKIQELVNASSWSKVTVKSKIGNTNVEYDLRKGDRVICTKNMYKAEHPHTKSDDDWLDDDCDTSYVCPVYNGDRGVIKEVSSSRLIVTFDMWGDIVIKRADFSKIELGYALSCHKLQGSEADYVIIGFDLSSKVLLTREWLYTAITRAKKHCVLTCESKALQYTIRTSNVPYKRTFLRELLEEVFKSE